jgi:hypothetical protein
LPACEQSASRERQRKDSCLFNRPSMPSKRTSKPAAHRTMRPSWIHEPMHRATDEAESNHRHADFQPLSLVLGA